MKGKRILFVDDEPNLRLTFPQILGCTGLKFAPRLRSRKPSLKLPSILSIFLISDLNIGEPGDGFTVVSAMRRTQPNCLNFILTGFPAFERRPGGDTAPGGRLPGETCQDRGTGHVDRGKAAGTGSRARQRDAAAALEPAARDEWMRFATYAVKDEVRPRSEPGCHERWRARRLLSQPSA